MSAVRIRPTPEQLRSADPSRSVWVTANAGTGKTRVLSDRILRLLLTGAHPESILAITFTKAAAAEMKTRVEAVLARWAITAEDEALADELEDLTGVAPSTTLVHAARRLFARVLDLPQGLQIQTIHALCAGLLRRFPIEAGVAPHFETIDDRTAGEMMIEAREEVLRAGQDGKDASLAAALDVLAITLGETSLTDAIQEMLNARLPLLAGEREHGGLEGLVDAIFASLSIDRATTPAQLVQEACRDGEYDAERLAVLAEIFSAGGARQSAAGQTIAAWLSAAPADRLRTFGEYTQVFLTGSGEPRRDTVTAKFDREQPAHTRTYVTEQARLARVRDRQCAVVIGSRTEALLRVGFAAIRSYERQKARSAALDFSDLVERVRLLLADPGRTEWVLFKLDERLSHLLVDEAQDTSPEQWDVVARLTDEFFAGQGAHDTPRTLFVVGDEKQSIYSFQGADLENFRKVRALFRSRAQAAGLELHDERIERSFRTSRAVLELVDTVLSEPATKLGVGAADDVVRHVTHRHNDAGHVELWPLFVGSEGEEDDAGDEWPLPGARAVAIEPDRRLAEAIATRIRDWLAAGERFEHDGRLVRPSDILILLQQRGAVQDLLIRSLKRAGVPVAGADRLGLAQHIAVVDLLALGNIMLLPEDDLTLAALLKSPLLALGETEPLRWGLSEDELFDLAHARGRRNLFEQLRAFARERGGRFALAYEQLRIWLQRADFMPPFEFFTRLLGEDGGRMRLQARLGPDAIDPIEAFLGQALAYEEGHPASLQGFLYWLGQDERQIKRDPEQVQDAVRVMTVHGSKGLEAPVVILADCGPHQRQNRARLIWDEESGLPYWRASKENRETVTAGICDRAEARQRDELRRLLYVALTRARDRLYIAGWQGKRAAREPHWHGLVETALHAMPELDMRPLPTGETALRLSRGQPLGPQAARAEAEATSLHLPLPDWARRPVPAETGPAAPLAPSHLDDRSGPPMAVSGVEAALALRRGRLVHALLALAPALPPAEREAAMLAWTRHQLGQEPALSPEDIVTASLRVIELPELQPLFGPGARVEQPIVGSLGDVAISGQIDRMVVLEDTIILVDFKTNARPPRDLARVPLAYLRQMAAYSRLLAELYPRKNVRCGLVWTESAAITWLPGALLEEQALRSRG